MSVTHHPTVAILIPTYNGEAYIDELFKSIVADSYPKKSLGIFVVDNASVDATVTALAHYQKQCAKLTLIRNSQNYFFAKAINQAADAAMREGYEYLILLNQDTIVESGWIDALMAPLKADSFISAAQARMMITPPSSGIINSLGNVVHYLGFGFSNANGKQWRVVESMYANPWWDIPYASGGAMMVRAKDWRQFGGLDEHLAMYHEDLALGWRMALGGFRSVCVRDAIVYHDYRSAPSAYKYYFMERNRLIVLLEYYKVATLIVLLPMLIVLEVGLLVFACVKGWWKEKFRSYVSVVLSIRIIIKKRRLLQATRTIPDRILIHRFASMIEDQPIDHWLLRAVGNPLMRWYHHQVARIVRW